MPACTFFGHRDTPRYIEPDLRAAIVDLIENEKVNEFYVGNQGAFDSLVKRVLCDLSKTYNIKYFVVIAYLRDAGAHTETLLPEGVEAVPQKFRINYRNEWMIKKSDFVIGYIRYSFGGAAKHFEIAKRKGKKIINLYKD